MAVRQYDKSFVIQFLEEHPKPYNSNPLVEKLAEKTSKNERTIRNWLKHYRDKWNCGNPKGVVYRKRGRETFYYAKKHQQQIEEKYREAMGLFPEYINSWQQEIIDLKKQHGTAFSFCLKDGIRGHVTNLEMI